MMDQVSRQFARSCLAGSRTLFGVLLTLFVAGATAPPALGQDVPLPSGCAPDSTVGAYVKRTLLKDRNGDGIPDRWFVDGDFDFAQPIDPVVDQPVVTFNWDSSESDFPTNPNSRGFEPRGSSRWRYIYKPLPPDPSPGFFRGSMKQLSADVMPSTKVRFFLLGKGVNLEAVPPDPGPPQKTILRQSIRVGQLCASTILCCKRTESPLKLRCSGPTNGTCQ